MPRCACTSSFKWFVDSLVSRTAVFLVSQDWFVQGWCLKCLFFIAEKYSKGVSFEAVPITFFRLIPSKIICKCIAQNLVCFTLFHNSTSGEFQGGYTFFCTLQLYIKSAVRIAESPSSAQLLSRVRYIQFWCIPVKSQTAKRLWRLSQRGPFQQKNNLARCERVSGTSNLDIDRVWSLNGLGAFFVAPLKNEAGIINHPISSPNFQERKWPNKNGPQEISADTLPKKLDGTFITEVDSTSTSTLSHLQLMVS